MIYIIKSANNRHLAGLPARVVLGMNISLRRWVLYACLNLMIVSILGVLLRYKGVFGLLALDYNYLLQAHSHFAFSGWVTTALFVGLLYILGDSGIGLSSIYRYQFWLNQVASFGMLVSFMVQGYAPVSIAFSSLSVVFSYWFAFSYWRDAKKAGWPPVVRRAIGFALFYLVLSSLGPYLLAYSMSHRVGDRAFYYNAIYLYLHFMYNGWFTFGVLALFFWWVDRVGRGGGLRRDGLARVFVSSLGFACVPAYCLSLLWTEPPWWVWVSAAVAALVQLAAGSILLVFFVGNRRTWAGSLPAVVRTLGVLSAVAFGIKLSLQALSVVPALGRLAFGHRSVIIAYLHLVLLGFVTLALLGFFVSQGLLSLRAPAARGGLVVFIFGVLLNEGVLLLQSLSQLSSAVWVGAGYWLFGAALVLCVGALLVVAAQYGAREGGRGLG